MQFLLIAAALLITLVGPVATVLADAPSRGPVLVLLPPWLAAPQLVQAAGGQMIGLPAPFTAVAYSDDPDFPDRLIRAGALAVRDGQRLASICGVAA